MLSVSQTDPTVARRIERRFGSVRNLAKSLDLSHTTVSRTLRGEMRGEATQRKIAKALGVSRPALFGKAA
jgi:uncharacterized membrane protein